MAQPDKKAEKAPTTGAEAHEQHSCNGWINHFPGACRIWIGCKAHPVIGCVLVSLVIGIPVLALFVDVYSARSIWNESCDPDSAPLKRGEFKEATNSAAETSKKIKAESTEIKIRSEEISNKSDAIYKTVTELAHSTMDIDKNTRLALARDDSLKEDLRELLEGPEVLVRVTPEELRRIRSGPQPELRLFYYEGVNNELITVDETAPEFKSGQFLNLQLVLREESVSPDDRHEENLYLLAIESNGDVHLYDAETVRSQTGGDWQIPQGINCETLLALRADHRLTSEEQQELRQKIRAVERPLSLRARQMYVWNSGEISGQSRKIATRDLKRNPEAPIQWAADVNSALVSLGLTFHGITYPVDGEPSHESSNAEDS